MGAFGQLLKDARKRARATLREVAEVGSMSISHVSDIEHGRRRPPDIDRVKEIERFLGVTNRSLSIAARSESAMPVEAKRIIMKKPEAMMALLRASEDLSEEQLQDLAERIKKEAQQQ